MSKNKIAHNANHPDYNEAEALEQLLKAIDEAADINDKLFDLSLDSSENITIIVGSKLIQLYLGGPQIQGLCKMVSSIADENGYEVDFNENTVKE